MRTADATAASRSINRKPKRYGHKARLDIVRRRLEFGAESTVRVDVANFCRQVGLCDEQGRPRYLEASRLLLCLAIVRIAGRDATECVRYAVASNRLMLVGAMCKRLTKKYATGSEAPAPTGKHRGKRINLTLDPWLHKQLTHLAPIYSRERVVFDREMVLDLLNKALSDRMRLHVASEYVRQIEPLRRGLAVKEREVVSMVDAVCTGRASRQEDIHIAATG